MVHQQLLEHEGHVKNIPLCGFDELAIGQRKCVQSKSTGRVIVVFRIGLQEWSAIDSACYHAGGRLGSHGDLEDIAGEILLTCPEHRHRINVRNGKLFDSQNRTMTERVVQRTFATFLQDGKVFARITGSSAQDPSSGLVDSDKYNLPHIVGGISNPATGGCRVQQSISTFARKNKALDAIRKKQLKINFSDASTVAPPSNDVSMEDVEMS